MCAEFTPGQSLEIEELLTGILIIRKIIRHEFAGRVFPRGNAPILIPFVNSGEAQLVESEFSLIPSWWNPARADKKTKTGRPVFATHNARIETILEKPTFRDSFAQRHCLVPIKNFFESSLFGSSFAGHRIRLESSGLLLAAGCYSEWIDASTGEVINSFTIITSDPNQKIFAAGHDRMPIFLNRDGGKQWLEMGKVPPKQMKDFLLERTINSKLELEISVDRALKAGWNKNSPEPSELEELRKRI